jgi:hypothetical protein
VWCEKSNQPVKSNSGGGQLIKMKQGKSPPQAGMRKSPWNAMNQPQLKLTYSVS